MEKLVNQSKRWMAALGAVAFLMVAGWQYNYLDSKSDLSDRIEALNLAFAGSGSSKCFAGSGSGQAVHVPRCQTGCPYQWYTSAIEIGTCSN